jgi:hypothetical protein
MATGMCPEPGLGHEYLKPTFRSLDFIKPYGYQEPWKLENEIAAD